MDKVLVTLFGIGFIATIYWFFFGKKEETKNAKNFWNITVEGGYKPGTITIPKDAPSSITFTRRDSNSCLEEVVLPEFKIKKYLPVGQPVTITLSPTRPGTFNFHCGMNMYHGTINVIS